MAHPPAPHRRDLLKRWMGAALMPALTACRRAGGRFPTQSVRLVVPYSVGSGTDSEARAIAPHVRVHLGVPVIVDNQPGADGRVALSQFARTRPDCYRLAFYGIPSMILGELLYQVPYRIRDFTHIFSWIRESQVLVVRSGSWVDTASFLAEAKRRRLTGGVPYLTSAGRLAGLLLAREARLRCGWIPFAGSNAAMAALLGGHVDFCITATMSCLALVRAGKLKPTLVFAEARDAAYPDVPTPAELGYRMPALPIVRGVVAPQGAEMHDVRVIEEAFLRATRDPEFLRQSAKTGTPVFPTLSSEYRQQVESYYQVIEPLRGLLLEEAQR